MLDFARLLMAVSGIGMIVIGIRGKKMWEIGYGGSSVGCAVFGYLARSNDIYSWIQLAFAIALGVLVLARIIQKRKSA